MKLRLDRVTEARGAIDAGIAAPGQFHRASYGTDGHNLEVPAPTPEEAAELAARWAPKADAAATMPARPSTAAPDDIDSPDDIPDDSSAADFAAQMTAHGFAACEHGKKNRCLLCRIERVREVQVGPDGKPAYPVRWRALGAARADAASQAPLPLGPPPTPNRSPHPYAGALSMLGLPVLVETAAGQTRSGADPDGRPWSVTMPWHYGEIAGTLGLDGEPIDVMVGPDPSAANVYVLHIRVPGTEQMEEDKAYLGFGSPEDALAAFRAAYTRRDLLSGFTRWHAADFARWVSDPANAGRRLDAPPGSGLETRGAPPGR